MHNLNNLEAYLARLKNFAIISNSKKIYIPTDLVDACIEEIKEIRYLIYESKSPDLTSRKAEENQE